MLKANIRNLLKLPNNGLKPPSNATNLQSVGGQGGSEMSREKKALLLNFCGASFGSLCDMKEHLATYFVRLEVGEVVIPYVILSTFVTTERAQSGPRFRR